ncbi:hypothetical protein [Jhaorihella thermophila]|uniref:Translocase n=1 Tax=Jhaorihella thermophila TaxID=488547 RepID=A0A1H5VM49_9RHOB|nr:hypothetical protein [Jhaorihella thermophila]SEF88359.1 hypothetical protein SAMN05421751_106117 [Jhaorihella thermophila]
MSRRRYMTTIGGTILCALGIVYFTQAGKAPAAAIAPQPSIMQQVVPTPAANGALREDAPADLDGLRHGEPLPGFHAPAPLPLPQGAEQEARRDTDCAVTATAAPGEMATVHLQVQAPCHRGERLTVHHGGMIFSDRTDANGIFAADIPALSERAVFIVAFADGKGAAATTRVQGLNEIDRIVLQWGGQAGFELHAREFGANYGDPGHVWFGYRGDGAVGRLIRLGNPEVFNAKLADIYSFPAGHAPRAGAVAVSVEAEVTENNCGRDISAQTVELKGGRLRNPRDLMLSMPDCDAVGTFLVLNNLVDDLKIAAR